MDALIATAAAAAALAKPNVRRAGLLSSGRVFAKIRALKLITKL